MSGPHGRENNTMMKSSLGFKKICWINSESFGLKWILTTEDNAVYTLLNYYHLSKNKYICNNIYKAKVLVISWVKVVWICDYVLIIWGESWSKSRVINRGISADLQITINSSRVFPRERLRRLDSLVYIYRLYTWRGHTPAVACVG